MEKKNFGLAIILVGVVMMMHAVLLAGMGGLNFFGDLSGSLESRVAIPMMLVSMMWAAIMLAVGKHVYFFEGKKTELSKKNEQTVQGQKNG